MENYHVFYEGKKGQKPSDVMRKLRKWLEDNEIMTSRLSYIVTIAGRVQVQATFGSRDHANLFERAFCLPANDRFVQMAG